MPLFYIWEILRVVSIQKQEQQQTKTQYYHLSQSFLGNFTLRKIFIVTGQPTNAEETSSKG